MNGTVLIKVGIKNTGAGFHLGGHFKSLLRRIRKQWITNNLGLMQWATIISRNYFFESRLYWNPSVFNIKQANI
jgi:hypothetical protein